MSIYLNDSVLIFLFLLGTKMQSYCVSLGEDNEHSLRWSCKVVVLWGNPKLDLSLFVRKIVNHEPTQPLESWMHCNRDCLGSRPLSSEVWALIKIHDTVWGFLVPLAKYFVVPHIFIICTSLDIHNFHPVTSVQKVRFRNISIVLNLTLNYISMDSVIAYGKLYFKAVNTVCPTICSVKVLES